MPQKTKHTPMMEQYFSIKKDYPDCLLFYRLGDFYELFYDDALKAAQILEITLTSRNKNAVDPIPMCGVPHHAARDYIRTLVELGHKVAICEQMEDPKQTKGMVKRGVVQVVTPGTFTEFSGQSDNNYLVAVKRVFDGYAVTYVDVCTGELRGTILTSLDALRNEFSSLANREIVVDTDELVEELREVIEYFQLVVSHHQMKDDFSDFVPEDVLAEVATAELVPAFELLLDYLVVTQKRSLSHIQKAEEYHADHSLMMSLEAKRNLELTTTIRAGQKHGSLFWFLDETKTAMGTRQLKKWIEKPLILECDILRRQSLVESLMDNFFERADIGDLLKTVYDLERIVGRVSFGSVNARDLLQLQHSLAQIPQIRALIESLNEPAWEVVLRDMDSLPQLAGLIDCAIDPDAPLSLTEGSLIKKGYSEQLDTYREAMTNGKQWIAQLQQRERDITGIKTLKISYNKVFGYFIEVTKANIQYLDEERYERKQTLANAERYITPELKEKERVILEAEEKSAKLEYDLFIKVREIVKGYTEALQRLAQAVATVDVIQAFAAVSEQYQFTKPVMSFEDRDLQIIDGRHPVVEKVMGRSTYVPNSIQMNEDEHILLITGPNMSGKSTYMRQLALCVILAQMGCFVPASSAKMPIFTKIFTRIGAADDLISGQSTFMVEMLETNHAIRLADQYSLLLFDEIGRGTATYDGMALAEAIITHIHDHIPAKVLFSTHYHELTDLSQKYPGLRNVHVGAVEKDGEVVFLHKIMEGPADKSYGIHVAKLAGMPDSLLANAEEILTRLETMADNHQAEMVAGNEVASQNEVSPAQNVVTPQNEVSQNEASAKNKVASPTVAPMQNEAASQTVATAQNMVAETSKATAHISPREPQDEIAQLDLFTDIAPVLAIDPQQQSVIEQLQTTNISNMTPLQVMLLVSQWQEELKGSR